MSAIDVEGEPCNGDGSGANSEIHDLAKCRIDKYDIERAIAELGDVIEDAVDMLQQTKKMKFEYLDLVCDVYLKTDYPTFMLNACERQVKQVIPSTKDLGQEFNRRLS